MLKGNSRGTGHIEGGSDPLGRNGNITYLGAWLNQSALIRIISEACFDAGISTRNMPEGLRIRETATERFWLNYSAKNVEFENRQIPSAGVLREPL